MYIINSIITVKVGTTKKKKKMKKSFNDEKLLEKYKSIQTKIEDLKSFELKVFPFSDDRYIKSKIRTCSDKVYTNFRGLNVPEDDIECESFTVLSSDYLLVY